MARIRDRTSTALGSRFSIKHTSTMMSTGDRYWITVAVPALESSMVTKYVYWQSMRPAIP